MLVVSLEEAMPVDINYDTIVIEERALHRLSGRVFAWD